MNLAELRAKWDADPEFRRLYAKEYPYDGQANALAMHRAAAGLTQRQYARRLGVPLATLRQWESGLWPVPAQAFVACGNAA